MSLGGGERFWKLWVGRLELLGMYCFLVRCDAADFDMSPKPGNTAVAREVCCITRYDYEHVDWCWDAYVPYLHGAAEPIKWPPRMPYQKGDQKALRSCRPTRSRS